jgi:hypothetical protein
MSEYEIRSISTLIKLRAARLSISKNPSGYNLSKKMSLKPKIRLNFLILLCYLKRLIANRVKVALNNK